MNEPRSCRTPLADLLAEAIDLYRDGLERGHTEEGAQGRAITEVLEGAAVRCVDLGREPCADCRAGRR